MTMLFDDEEDILSAVRMILQENRLEVLHFNGNSFNKKIEHAILDVEHLVADNGHAAVPPDYFSEKHSIMFDVMRVNDSELKKSYNPVKIRERKLFQAVEKEFGLYMPADAPVIVATESDIPEEHCYKNYVKNSQRVIGAHIDKLPLWKNKHQDIKYSGLFIFDETETYFTGMSRPSGNLDKPWFRAADLNCGFHKPWLDRRLMQSIYESEIDFVIWFEPYKVGGIAMECGVQMPAVVFLDTRFCFDKYIDYSDKLVC